MIQNKYNIQNKIGCGSFSNVFIAKNIYKNNLVVIKFDNDKNSKKLLRNEIDIYIDLLKRSKKDFISIKSFGSINEHSFIVMEYIPQTIQEYVRINSVTLSPNKIFEDLAETVKHLHKYGYVHRDLKPDNILVKNNKIILIDMGMASRRSSKLLTGFIGSPAFSSYNTHLKMYKYKNSDDIISCIYITLYLFSEGLLPWTMPYLDSLNEQISHSDIYFKKTKTDFHLFYKSFDSLSDIISIYLKTFE